MQEEAKQIPPYLRDKRNEIIYALVKQGYNQAQLSVMFNLSVSRMSVIVAGMPKDYRTKWVKRDDV